MLHILEDSIVKPWIELYDEGVITQTKAELPLILEEKAKVGKDEELFFVLLAGAYHFIQGEKKLISVLGA